MAGPRFKPDALRHTKGRAIHYFSSSSLAKEMTIRVAAAKDMDFIRELSALVFSRYGPYDKTLPRWAESENTLTYVAAAKSSHMGFAILGPVFKDRSGQWTAELLAIAVNPKYQGRGIGRALLEKIMETAKGLRINRLTLHTAKTNLVARKLFSRYGFTVAEEKKGFYKGGQDAVMMCKVIEP